MSDDVLHIRHLSDHKQVPVAFYLSEEILGSDIPSETLAELLHTDLKGAIEILRRRIDDPR